VRGSEGTEGGRRGGSGGSSGAARAFSSKSSTRVILEVALMSAVEIANRFSFLFILIMYRRAPTPRGPKSTPPPRRSGVRIEPWRARPVPFCL